MTQDSDKERIARLEDVLREARASMVELKSYVDDEAKRSAIGESLDYAVVAIDSRIAEVKQSVYRGLVGTEQDGGMRLVNIAGIFEAALNAHGFLIVAAPPQPEATS